MKRRNVACRASESLQTSSPSYSGDSSGSVGLFQGAIFLAAGAIAPIMPPTALANLSYIGNILIFCIGTNLLGLPYIRVANFPPPPLSSLPSSGRGYEAPLNKTAFILSDCRQNGGCFCKPAYYSYPTIPMRVMRPFSTLNPM